MSGPDPKPNNDSTAVPLDAVEHPFREAFVHLLRPEDSASLAASAALVAALIREGAEALTPYLPDGRLPDERDFALAIAADLAFSGRLLAEFLDGAELTREERQLADFCHSLGSRVLDLAATLARFADGWRSPEQRPAVTLEGIAP
jgi:hypothetical protein